MRSTFARSALALVAIALVTSGVTLVARAKQSTAPFDLHGRRVALDPGTTPDASARTRMHATEDTGRRFRVPSVHLDVPLGALTMADRAITPPGFTSAYLVRNLGASPETPARGTVFVVMHSLRDGAVGPGNYLIDVDAGTARVAKGARIEVGPATYAVTGTRAIGKAELPGARSVWRDTPGRLVIITCLQRPGGGPSVDNIVITAELVAAHTDLS
ncbi:class F sortase [Flexivirga caeni]|uniref:class F sortase n=1 Tax=Flexivirga caeni TaxID=2294115 RepID=UPI001FE7B405|nr:class F sortase [Flexivirga caeni]